MLKQNLVFIAEMRIRLTRDEKWPCCNAIIPKGATGKLKLHVGSEYDYCLEELGCEDISWSIEFDEYVPDRDNEYDIFWISEVYDKDLVEEITT